MKIVIRAGGVGTRLWPISRQNNPKQFQAIVNDKSLIRNTVDRVKPLLENESGIFISVSQQMVKKLKKEIPELTEENIIVEPESKNTGPAVCLESCVLAQHFGEDTVVASLPSDDYISDEVTFCEMLRQAEKFLDKNSDYVVTPGAKPTCPDTGYSYTEVGESLGVDGAKIFKVTSWVEKPTIYRCKKLIQSGKYFYHTGMYVWKLKTILDLFKNFQPKMYEVCSRLATGQEADYDGLEKITIESAITQKAPKIAVIVSDFGWSDLGKWHIVAKMLSPDKNGNVTKGKVLAIDTQNCLIYGSYDKLVAAIGINDIVIVQTEDAMLICPKEKSGEVKKIVEELEKRGMEEYV